MKKAKQSKAIERAIKSGDLVRVKGPIVAEGKIDKREQKTAAALERQAAAVQSALFKGDELSPHMRAALDYERSAHPSAVSLSVRFRVGDVCTIERKRCVCYRVNDCRACFTPVSRVVTDFVATDDNTVSVSANAELTIEQRLGSDWQTKLFGQTPEEQTNIMKKPDDTAAPEGKRSAKAKRPKSDKQLNPIGAPVLESGHISLAGRSKFIKQLMDKGERELDVIMEKVRAKWPTHCSRAHIGKAVKAYAAKLKA